jgi:hypothetical protein
MSKINDGERPSDAQQDGHVMTVQLPPVDPDFLIVERDQKKLDAYARGLLAQLRRIRSGQKAQGYPIATIKAAAVWLITSYSTAGIEPAPEAAQLIDEILQPNRGASTLPVRRSSEAAYLAAIEFEATHRPNATGNAPSMATLYAVGRHVRPLLQNQRASQKTAEATVRGWRRLRHYRQNVALQRPAAIRVKT